MKRIIIPLLIMRYVEDEKIKVMGRIILNKNNDIDVVHFTFYGKTIEVKRGD